jgi:hypothetical protein
VLSRRDQNLKGANYEALGAWQFGALTIDDIFDAFTRLLGDMAAMIGEPRTMTLNLPHLQSLPGWYQ